MGFSRPPDSLPEHTSLAHIQCLDSLFQILEMKGQELRVPPILIKEEEGNFLLNLSGRKLQYMRTANGVMKCEEAQYKNTKVTPLQAKEVKDLLTHMYKAALAGRENTQNNRRINTATASVFDFASLTDVERCIQLLEAHLGINNAVPPARPPVRPNPRAVPVNRDVRRLPPPSALPLVLPTSPEEAMTVVVNGRPPVRPPAAKPEDLSLEPQTGDGPRTSFFKAAVANALSDAKAARRGQAQAARMAEGALGMAQNAQDKAQAERERRRQAEREAEAAHGALWKYRRLIQATLLAAAVASVPAMGTAAYVVANFEEIKEAIGIAEPKLVQPLSVMKLPEGISDTGALLLAAAPVEQGELYEDSLLDRYGLMNALFGGKFLILGAEEVAQGAAKVRQYRFAVPSQDNGEQESGETKASFAEAIQILVKPDATDEELKNWITTWMASAYKTDSGQPLSLEKDKLEIKRDEKGVVTKVLYSGSNKAAKIRYEQARMDEKASRTGVIARRTTSPQPKAFVGPDDELLLFTGGTPDQQLLIPELLLKPDGTGDLQAHGKNYTFTWKELASSVRYYFEIKDQQEVKDFTDLDGKFRRVDTWNRYTTPKDPILLRMVTDIVEGKTGVERFEVVRKALQDTPYVRESRNTEANRPPVATLLKQGGDCNNHAVKAASYLEAAGYDAALLYAMRSDAEAKAAEARGDDFAYSTHVLVGVDKKDLGFDPAPDAVIFKDNEGIEWVVLETNGNFQLGQMPLTDFHVVLADAVR